MHRLHSTSVIFVFRQHRQMVPATFATTFRRPLLQAAHNPDTPSVHNSHPGLPHPGQSTNTHVFVRHNTQATGFAPGHLLQLGPHTRSRQYAHVLTRISPHTAHGSKMAHRLQRTSSPCPSVQLAHKRRFFGPCPSDIHITSSCVASPHPPHILRFSAMSKNALSTPPPILLHNPVYK